MLDYDELNVNYVQTSSCALFTAGRLLALVLTLVTNLYWPDRSKRSPKTTGTQMLPERDTVKLTGTKLKELVLLDVLCHKSSPDGSDVVRSHVQFTLLVAGRCLSIAGIKDRRPVSPTSLSGSLKSTYSPKK